MSDQEPVSIARMAGLLLLFSALTFASVATLQLIVPPMYHYRTVLATWRAGDRRIGSRG